VIPSPPSGPPAGAGAGRRAPLRGPLLVAIAALAATAWIILAAGGNVHGPHAHPPGTQGFFLSVTMWFVMMVAMMLPAVLPWLTTFGEMALDAYPGRSPYAVVAQFAGGYFVVWLAYSAAAAGLQGGLQRAALLRLDLSVGTTIGGLMLIVAGIFQLTPLKEACLEHCRSPLSFFLERWDGGPSGPLRMGVRHGLFCAACCWALMALAFVLGVMNLAWMAVLTVVIVTEQWAPRRLHLGKAFGVAFLLWGAILITTG